MTGQALLTLDLGNTSLKVLHWQEGRVVGRWRYFHGEADPLPACQESLPDLPGVEKVLGVRVPGPALPALPRSWPSVLWAGEDLEIPGRVSYSKPEEMGADRRVAAWGARSLHGRALILDCGTAVTLTHVTPEGEIDGLAISAGLGTLRRGLAQAAPTLADSLAEERPVPEGLPRGSAENLSLGVIHGWAGLLRELVAQGRRRLQDPGTLVLTGSDASLAADLLGEGEIQADLLHLGLLALVQTEG